MKKMTEAQMLKFWREARGLLRTALSREKQRLIYEEDLLGISEWIRKTEKHLKITVSEDNDE